jgi:hypothetical protein
MYVVDGWLLCIGESEYLLVWIQTVYTVILSVAQVQVQTSYCLRPEICTVYAVYHICHKLEY